MTHRISRSRLAEIQAHVEEYGAPADAEAILPELLAEVERLNGELDSAQRRYVFDTADLKRENEQLRSKRQEAEAKLLAVAQVRVWRNEDGKGFLFSDDVRAAFGLAATEAQQ